LKGAIWRREKEARLIIMAGWVSLRMSGKRPDVPEILADREPAPGPATPQAVWNRMLDWAAQMRGVRIEVHDEPVM
jgi:hypothetical protein